MNINNKIEKQIFKQKKALKKVTDASSKGIDIKTPYYYEGFKIGYMKGLVEGLEQASKIIEEENK